MVFKIKNKIKSVLLLSLFIFACLSPMFATGQEIKPALVKPTYSWQETTYNYSLYREWTGNSVVIIQAHTQTYLALICIITTRAKRP